MESIKEIVNLSEGEQVIREYHAIEQYGILKKLDGKIALTNKRVIAYSKARWALGEHETINENNLDGIEGVAIASGFDVSSSLLIAGIAAAIVGLIVMVSDEIIGGILLLIGGIGLAILSFGREYKVEVRSNNGGTGEPINYPFIKAKGYMIAKVCGPDADVLMKGLGATISDIKLRGEKLLEGLKCSNPGCSYVRPFDENPPKHCPECGASWGAQ
ncbi:MAG: hypothetical protein ACT6FF_08400 [Methanosarcinaceae archaeon]